MIPYYLRFQLLPGRDAEACAARLAAFCREHGVAEVVLMTGAEEFHTGHPQGADEDLWYEIAAAATGPLRKAGLSVSLNPWVTAGHTDRGRISDGGFAPMVSPAGETATATASFACPRWRAWVAGHYGRFAELGFRVMWIEDDLRYHNHDPLTWGGGFEPEMLARLAELTGADVTREELVAAITAPGPPHPWRAALREVWRTAQLEVVRAIREAVGGRARLGLMSSGLGVASAEGRDWARLFEEVSAHRPHFAPPAGPRPRGHDRSRNDRGGHPLVPGDGGATPYAAWRLDGRAGLRPAPRRGVSARLRRSHPCRDGTRHRALRRRRVGPAGRRRGGAAERVPAARRRGRGDPVGAGLCGSARPPGA